MGILESGGVEEGAAQIRLAFVESLEATGQAERARAALVAARAWLLERAGRISDERFRQSFLENVPEHARTLALAASRCGA